MEKVTLGSTGIEVSEMCLGTMYFGVKVEEELSHHLMDIYYDRGGRFYDTANKYATWVPGYEDPVGEKMIGRWLKSRGHKDAFIATKMGFPYADVPMSLKSEFIIQEVEKSLSRLEVDCIDLLYGHVDDYGTEQEEYIATFDKLVKQGKVREIGMSNIMAWRLARANEIAVCNDMKEISCVQTRLSVLWPNIDGDFGNQRPASHELLDIAKRMNITLLCYSPLLQGCFGRSDRDIPKGYECDFNRKVMSLIIKLSEKYEISGNNIVLSWMLEQGYIPLITGSNEEQIIQNCKVKKGIIEPEDLTELNKMFFPSWL